MPVLDPSGTVGSASSEVGVSVNSEMEVDEAPFVRGGRFRCAGLILIDRLGVALGCDRSTRAGRSRMTARRGERRMCWLRIGRPAGTFVATAGEDG
jgi:hypothetical protein